MSRRIALLVGAMPAVIGLVLMAPSSALAAPLTITVNRIGDASDLNAGNGKCDSSTASGAQCTLRAAIQEANANPGADVVKFNITTSSKVIRPASELPAITEKLTINGYSQPGSSANTLATGDNAVLRIVLDGINAGADADGLDLEATGATIKGLNVQHFDGTGIVAGGTSNVITGNFVGTNVKGTAAQGNGRGISASGTTNTIGGTTAAARNIISGNSGSGIESPGSGNVIQGNYVGTDATGNAALGNGGDGIFVLFGTSTVIGSSGAGGENVISANGSDGIDIFGGSSTTIQRNRIGAKASGTGTIGNDGDGIFLGGSGANNTVGGTGATANVIAGNGRDGIAMSDAPGAVVQGNAISGNQGSGISALLRPATISGNAIIGNGKNGVTIFGAPNGVRIHANQIIANVELGIDLQGGTEDSFGVTANDLADPDGGPNHLQNFPVLSQAVRASNGVSTISGSLNSVASTTYTIEFFIAVPDGSGHGEGQIFLGTKSVTTNSAGNVSFTFVTGQTVAGQSITATAIREPGGDTSEFSANAFVIQQ